MFAEVTITPILKNSLKVKVALCLLSAASKIITLLAAPKIVKFPAIVLPLQEQSKILYPLMKNHSFVKLG